MAREPAQKNRCGGGRRGARGPVRLRESACPRRRARCRTHRTARESVVKAGANDGTNQAARAQLAPGRPFARAMAMHLETPTDFSHPHDQERRAAVAAAWCLATSQTGAPPPAATPDSKLAKRRGHSPDLGSGSIDQEVTSMCKRRLGSGIVPTSPLLRAQWFLPALSTCKTLRRSPAGRRPNRCRGG